ncbi:MAG: phosphoribosylaminoimidazolesuccinocarboxamide synthase [Planctomycetes bacterium]|nr:phosphoribosylaminoimidazolesuccinocarboxamide synthase [Planctomycetota bacterium]
MNEPTVVLETKIPELKLFGRGKVRDIYELPPHLLVVTTDRISAFDVILSDGIPLKGNVLTAISAFWFNLLRDITPSHFITDNFNEIKKLKPELAAHETVLKGRSMLVKKCEIFPVECVVRGYMAGSGWKEYQKSGTVCGIKLKDGIKESDKLDEPIFTPSTKATSGHDENINYERMSQIIGEKHSKILMERSLQVYQTAHKYALEKGIIISDTKFEWGKSGNDIILADEVLTPDSSRFWPKDKYQAGKGQPSFDKQFVRDYLEVIKWDKNPPPPKLPEAIIKKTTEKYLEAYERLTGNPLIIN